MEQAKKIRLFVAADAPADRLAAVDESIDDLRRSLPDARWMAPDARHITLKFLGSTNPDLLDPLKHAIGNVAARRRPARLALSDLGAFPSTRKARVLWVGIDDPDEALTDLARMLDEAAEQFGFEPESRPFRAHLTLARFRTPARLPELPPLPATDPFELDRIRLWRSHLSPKGASYEALGDFPLGGPGSPS